jgi:hypothetical protein
MTSIHLKNLQGDLVRFSGLFFMLLIVTPIIHYQMHELGLAASLQTYGFKFSASGYCFYLFGILFLMPYLIFYRLVHIISQRMVSQTYATQHGFLKFIYNFCIPLFFAFIFPILIVLTESWLSGLFATTVLGLEFNGNLIYIFRNPVTLFIWYLLATIYSWRSTKNKLNN